MSVFGRDAPKFIMPSTKFLEQSLLECSSQISEILEKELTDGILKIYTEPLTERKIKDCSTIELFKVIRDRANGKN